jgi:hypothetical protein
MMNRETKDPPKKSGTKRNERPHLRKSTGGSLQVPSSSRAGSKSAGNSPNSSPLLSKSVVSRQHQLDLVTRRKVTEDDENDSYVDVDSTTPTEASAENLSENFGKDTENSACAVSMQNLATPNRTDCPCQQDSLKGTFVVQCCKCLQAWHPECSNLRGITPGAAKKLKNWNCLRCIVLNMLSTSDQLRMDNDIVSKFLLTTTEIERYTEDLKESASSLDFFNTHIKHLLLHEDSFVDHTAKIAQLEQHVEEIKSMLKMILQDRESERASAEKETVLMKDLAEIKELLRNTRDSTASSDNHLDLNEVKQTIENINKCGTDIEDKTKSLSEELHWLKDLFSTGESMDEAEETPPERSIFKNIDLMISEMNDQLKSINEHICPQQRAESSLALTLDGAVQESPHDESNQLAMTPNTVSPHFIAPSETQNTSPPCEPFLKYTEGVVSGDLKTRLAGFLTESSNEFKTIGGSREVIYFGEYGYFYTGAYHEAKITPPIIQELLDTVRQKLPDQFKNSWLNSCLVTRYPNKNSSIPFHKDNESFIDPESVIVTVSMGCERTIKFVSESQGEKQLNLKDGSVYLMSRFSQDYWQHGIEPEKAPEATGTEDSVPEIRNDNGDQRNESDDDVDQSSVRYSFTFRHIAPHFANSTAIIGDSNTQNIKFGRSVGTLGKWVPGKRMKASKIEHIPPPHEIGPFRNIVLHTGINNISDETNRRSNKSLITLLKRKCDDIQAFYPACKLHVSLLLPTKSSYVNSRIAELNSLILDMCFNRKNTFVIDNSVLGDDRGLLPPNHGRYLYSGSPNSSDIVHLGRDGIKKFCKNIKRCVMHKGASQSRERFNGSRGNYGSAAGAVGRRGSISPR